ncbi:hypothetical protein M441DRAFT_366207 [Trichoderma asperellum CBS 433.97]|uniref:Uncharacterized protein n=1 Tax=Trichoderma asperellum (strain ATCC 204424 / CBS 433.97 / NBRC 101777) TaxID=1042311 RepID=A0A2T3ZE81_TRIA4|nr:hypothetical protein M441DRAFT_366207 [Trichoderma asperellum CBS 433.97]PTB43122.1 hypothetical protein M441DRAFT_366207 [Trichoderma asperellum CBS 433.97]
MREAHCRLEQLLSLSPTQRPSALGGAAQHRHPESQSMQIELELIKVRPGLSLWHSRDLASWRRSLRGCQVSMTPGFASRCAHSVQMRMSISGTRARSCRFPRNVSRAPDAALRLRLPASANGAKKIAIHLASGSMSVILVARNSVLPFGTRRCQC